MNKAIIKNRFSKACKSYSESAVAQQMIASRLASLIGNIKTDKTDSVLEIGCGSGRLTQAIYDLYHPEKYIANDLSANWEEQIKQIGNIEFISGDAEKIDFKDNFDIIASASTFQWFSDFESFCSKIRNNMHTNSLFAFSTFIPGNFIEIKNLTGIGLEYLSFESIENILSKDYEIIYSNNENIRLHFKTPYDVLNHLRQTGVTGITNFKWNKENLLDFYNKYNSEYKCRDMVTLTYIPAYFVARLKKESK
ncbi:MAG: malonyl-ACP O-methyltransferase BioC [Bacteroidales bacterium]|nr:malonyl-ACP O-methyltransferase BioC [Bacteroidales bacterium]